MKYTPAPDIYETTRLLKAWSDGDETALERPVPTVDAEFCRLAQHYLRQERQGHILQTAAWSMKRGSTVSLAGGSDGREAVDANQGSL